jgi:WD40 repeat protein
MFATKKKQERHNAPIRNVAWLPDSRHLFSGDDRGYLALSDAPAGKLLRMWQCHPTSISALKTAPDLPLLATAAVDGTVRLWRYPNPQVVGGEIELMAETRYGGEVAGLEFQPHGDGALAIAAATGQVSLWQQGNDVPEDIVLLPAQANSTAWSPDGKVLAVGCDDFAVYLIDVETRRQVVLRGHTHHADQLGYSRCGRFVASGSHDKTVRVWNVADGRCLAVLPHDLDTVKADWSADGRLVTCSYDQKVRIWDPLRGTLLATLHGHAYDVDDVAWSPNCNFIASCGWDNRVIIFSGQDYRVVSRMEGGTHQVYAMACSPNGSGIYAGTTAGRVFHIPLPSPASEPVCKIASPHEGVITSLDVASNGAILASTSSDSTIVLSEIGPGGVTKVLRQSHNLDIEIVRFSPCGRYLATGARDSSATIYRLNGVQAEVVRRYDHERRVKAVCWAPDRPLVATGADGNIRIFDAPTGEILHQWRGHERMINALCWSPDGGHIISASWDRTIRVFDSEGVLVRTFEGSSYNVNSIDIHSDGERLTSACWDGTISLWSLSTGSLRNRFQAPGHSPVQLVRWLPETDLLAASTWDGEVLLYDPWQSSLIAKWNLNQ